MKRLIILTFGWLVLGGCVSASGQGCGYDFNMAAKEAQQHR